MGISVIYFNNFQYNKAVEQRRVDPVVRTGPKSVLALSRMSSAVAVIPPRCSADIEPAFDAPGSEWKAR